MEGFQVNKEPIGDYHFWIKGRYHEITNEFGFSIYINPEIQGSDVGDFFEELKQQLEKRRSLEETTLMIRGMLKHQNERVQELGKIIEFAADKGWAEYLLESNLYNDIPGEENGPRS